MHLPNTIDTFVPLDAHQALVARGLEWQRCHCDRGRVHVAYGTAECADCDGEGGRYVADQLTAPNT